MRTAKEFRAQARKVLSGRYWWTVLVGLVATILGGTATSGASAGGASGSSAGTAMTDIQGSIQSGASDLASAISPAVWIAFGSLMLVVFLVSLVLLFVGSAVELGYDRFNISLYERADNPPMGELFSRFSIYGRALWLRILMGLKIFLWSLLFFIPGIIAQYRYAMAPYIMAENPDLTASEAINKSKEMMAGHKWRLFCLRFSFIGWALLGALAFGAGLILLPPYVKAAETAFYLERTGRLPVEVQAQPVYSAPQAGTEQL